MPPIADVLRTTGPLFVIPAKAGTQLIKLTTRHFAPANAVRFHIGQLMSWPATGRKRSALRATATVSDDGVEWFDPHIGIIASKVPLIADIQRTGVIVV